MSFVLITYNYKKLGLKIKKNLSNKFLSKKKIFEITYTLI